MTYSIIIPHYNLPHLLKRCVDSIPERNDVEIIIVDDCSDITHKGILYQITDRRQNLKLIELDSNNGGGYARNEGLKYANGKWIIFADSDDFFNYCIDQILDDYRDASADIIFFKANSLDCDTFENASRTALAPNKYIDAWLSDENNADEKLRYLHGVPWGKLIRRELIESNHLQFDNTRIHNDTTFSYLSGHYAKGITADPRCLYCITDRPNSVSQQKGIKYQLTTIEILGRGVVFFHRIGKTYFENYLAANLYLLIRSKDYIHFNEAIETLNNLGLSVDEIQYIIAREMGRYSILSLLKYIIKAPNKKCAIKGINQLFSFALPYHLRNAMVGKAEN